MKTLLVMFMMLISTTVSATELGDLPQLDVCQIYIKVDERIYEGYLGSVIKDRITCTNEMNERIENCKSNTGSGKKFGECFVKVADMFNECSSAAGDTTLKTYLENKKSVTLLKGLQAKCFEDIDEKTLQHNLNLMDKIFEKLIESDTPRNPTY